MAWRGKPGEPRAGSTKAGVLSMRRRDGRGAFALRPLTKAFKGIPIQAAPATDRISAVRLYPGHLCGYLLHREPPLTTPCPITRNVTRKNRGITAAIQKDG